MGPALMMLARAAMTGGGRAGAARMMGSQAAKGGVGEAQTLSRGQNVMGKAKEMSGKESPEDLLGKQGPKKLENEHGKEGKMGFGDMMNAGQTLMQAGQGFMDLKQQHDQKKQAEGGGQLGDVGAQNAQMQMASNVFGQMRTNF